MRTDWKKLRNHLAAMNLGVGQTVTLNANQLRQILGVGTLPPFASRVTAWDPIMGKPGGLQRVVRDLKLFPISFEWQGSHDQRPILVSVTLVKWGSV